MAKILIIDDNAALRRVMLRALRNAHYTVFEAQDGREGLALLETHGADLVITDIIMPETEGIETLREVLKGFPGTKIMVISGGGTSHNLMYLDMARALGADATLAKPFRPAQLLEAVEQLLPGGDPSLNRAC